MPMINPNENCHTYCPVAKCCRYALGEVGFDYNECGTYYKLLDLLEEAKTIKWEQEKARMDEEDDDW